MVWPVCRASVEQGLQTVYRLLMQKEHCSRLIAGKPQLDAAGSRLSQVRYDGGAGAFDKFFTFFCPKGFTAGAKLRIMRAIAGA